MPNTIPVSDWLNVLDEEYLSTFIKNGGASVKFAVTPDESKQNLYMGMKNRCHELDYVFAELDAGLIRAHMPQDIFFGLSKQIDWQTLARRLILRLAAERGFQIGGIDPYAHGSVFEAIANVNRLEPQSILFELRPAIQDNVLKDSNMVKDFRTCMFHLCLMNDRHTAQEQGFGHPLLDWITGVNTRIGNVRNFAIHTSINRTTARYFIESAFYWVRHVGYSGTVILLDNSRVTLARNPKDGKRYYTKPMALEHYELLREFIDGVDRLSGTLLVTVTNYDFLDEQSARGYGIYPALRTRVMDDVRDRNMVNPVASLVRLSEYQDEEDVPW